MIDGENLSIEHALFIPYRRTYSGTPFHCGRMVSHGLQDRAG